MPVLLPNRSKFPPHGEPARHSRSGGVQSQVDPTLHNAAERELNYEPGDRYVLPQSVDVSCSQRVASELSRNLGRSVIALAVSRRLPTATAWVQARDRLRFSFLSIPLTDPYSSSGAGTIGQTVANVPS
jgi:hypothetical protein